VATTHALAFDATHPPWNLAPQRRFKNPFKIGTIAGKLIVAVNNFKLNAQLPSRMSMALKTSSIVYTYIVVSVVALVWRAVFLPWDWGGFFLQFMAACWGLMVFGSIDFQTLTRFQRIFFYALFVMACLLSFEEVYFAPQAIAPLIIVCFILALIWGKAKKSNRIYLISVLALPLIGLLYYGLSYTFPIYRLRHLSPQQVQAVNLKRLAPADQGGTEIQLTSETQTTPFLQALRKTAPYAPNHENLNSPWQATILLNSGEKIYIEIGKGTRANANTCRVTLGVTSYQNEPLCRLLKSLAPQW